MKIVQQEIKGLTLAIRAFNHPLRQRILTSIKQAGEIEVQGVEQKHGLVQSVASQHLAILRRADLVRTRRNGKYILYRVNEDAIKQLLKLGEDWDNPVTPKSTFVQQAVPQAFRMAAI